jgi:hypothetical protein
VDFDARWTFTCVAFRTFDTGVGHMAIFADPDGNQLMLHHRCAP